MVGEEQAVEGVTGLGNMIAKGLSEPMIRIKIQPGRYKYPNRKKLKNGKVQMGKRKFVPNPMYPEGFQISFPAWFVATVGIGVVIYAVGGIENILSGGKPSKKEKSAVDTIFDVWSYTSPVGIAGKALGLF